MPGHKANFVHPLLKRYECPICLFAMRNPVQTECGHLFCKDCLDPVLRRRRPICPLDKEPITQDRIFPDNACQREILHLEVYCNYGTSGCSWTGTLKDLDAHIQICKFGAPEGEESTPETCFSCSTLQDMDFSEAEPGCSYCLPFVQNEPSASSLNVDIEFSNVYTVPIPDSGTSDPRLRQLVTGALH